MGIPLVAILVLMGSASASAQLPPPPVPPGNPITVEKTLLGKALFWDEQLSATRTVACGTCHFPEHGGTDRRSRLFPAESTHPGVDALFGTPDDVIGSQGVIRNQSGGAYEPAALFGLEPQVTPRKAPSFLNTGYPPLLFWDGRADSVFRDPLTNQVVLDEFAALESQAVNPPVSEVEMGHVGIAWPEVADRIPDLRPLALATDVPAELANFIGDHTYAQLFSAAFDSVHVTPSRIALALATYQRTLVSDEARVDNFPNGFTDQEIFGGTLFDTKARCAFCHSFPLITDHSFRNIGLRPIAEDPGRGAITGDPADDGKFKMPSLRNVELRAPFFHGGFFDTLEEVVDFYDRAGDFHVNQDPEILQLNLTQVEKDALVAYLKTFTDERVRLAQPPFDRPTLYTESSRVPALFGDGVAGTGGRTPQMIAVEPPFVGNPEFTVGVKNALGGGQAFLLLSTRDATVGPFGTGAMLRADLDLDIAPPYRLVPVGLLAGAGAGAGFGSATFDLSTLGFAAVGTKLFGQWLVVDAGAAGGMATSDAFELTFF